ncbi:MAG: hypothetical protein ACKPGB_05900, partial [Dolichospermum sp.]
MFVVVICQTGYGLKGCPVAMFPLPAIYVNTIRMPDCLHCRENISIFTKGKGTIKKVRIDKLEYDNISNSKAVIDNIRRIISLLNRINTLEDFLLFKQGKYSKGYLKKSGITISEGIYEFHVGSKAYKT